MLVKKTFSSFQKYSRHIHFFSFLFLSHYQAIVRTNLNNYVWTVNGDSITNLTTDLDFYTRYSEKPLVSRMQDLASLYQIDYTLDEVYYPWNRTFEIGLLAH